MPERPVAAETPNGLAPLPRWKAIVYGLGSFASTMMTSVIVTWLLYYASGSQDGATGGAGHGLFGLAMAIGRIADALADPFVGRWSDRTRTRIGRRLPFVLGGLLPMALLFVLLWLPYTSEPLLNRAVRISVTLSAFFALYTVVVCPYLAMLPEITTDPKSRVQLATWQAVGSVVGGGSVILLLPRLIDQSGFMAGAGAVAVVSIACFGLIVLAFLRGPRREAPARQQLAAGGLREPLAAAWQLMRGERAFGLYLLGVAALWIGLNTVTISLPYFVTVVLGHQRTAVARLGLVSVAGTAATVPWIGRLAARWGKVEALRRAGLVLAVCLPLMAAGRTGVWVALIGTGPALAFVYVLPNLILAEIIDRHRRKHGDGEAALHFGAQGMALKGALAIAAWMAGLLFASLGAGPDAQMGIRVSAIVAGLLCLVATIVLRRVGLELALPSPEPKPVDSATD